MWKGICHVEKNLLKFSAYFGDEQKGNLEAALESFVQNELENFNFKKNKREKSLALLSLNLVQFFYQKGFLQTQEDTANQLTGGQGAKLKTKIRRLYDITNVFKAIGLIKKTVTADKKVAIEWLGLKGFQQFSKELKLAKFEKKNQFSEVKIQKNDNFETKSFGPNMNASKRNLNIWDNTNKNVFAIGGVQKKES